MTCSEWERLLHISILAVVVLALQAIAINRLAGIDYPLWNPRREAKG